MTVLVVIATIVIGIAQFYIGLTGVYALYGALPVGIVLFLLIFFRIGFPIGICAFISAYYYFHWPLIGAILFAIPGVVFIIPGMVSSFIAMVKNRSSW